MPREVARAVDRTVLVLSVAMSSVPFAASLVLVAVSRGPDLGLIIGGALVTGQILAYLLMLGRASRFVRGRDRMRQIFRGGITLGVAASPVGHWLASEWRAVGVLTGVTGAVVLPGILAGLRFGERHAHRAPAVVRMAVGLARRLCDAVLVFGLLPFCLVGLFWPDRALIVPAVAFAAVEATMFALYTRYTLAVAIGWTCATQLAAADPHVRDDLLQDWLLDAFAAHPRRPDYLLVHGLAALATANLAEPGPQVGAQSQHLVALAQRALQMVKTTLLPALPREYLPVLSVRHERARAHALIAAGNTQKYLLEYEEALMCWREAAQIADEAHAPNTAAMVRLSAAALRLIELSQPEAVVAELGDDVHNDQLNPVARRSVLTMSAAAAAARGEAALAASRLEAARRLAVKDRHHVALMREVEGAAYPRPPRSIVRAHRAEIERWERLYAATADPALDKPIVESSIMESPAGRLALRGHALWLKGRAKKAEALLTVAAESAAETNDHIWLFRIHRDLGYIRLFEHRDLLTGYSHLARAIKALDEVRVRTLDPDLRIGVGGEGRQVYEFTVAALYAAAQRPGPHPAPLDRPLCSALEVAERMRSRVFLELLASTDHEGTGDDSDRWDPARRAARSELLRQSAPATFAEIQQMLTSAG